MNALFIRSFFTVSIILLLPVAVTADTLHVPGQYPKIQDAIYAANPGDTVLVEPGTYVENIDFLGKAITVTSEQGADTTTIDGGEAGSVVTCQSGENDRSVLNGFTIMNGENFSGGGMYNLNSSPTVTNCVFTENWAFNGGSYYAGGGGMYNENSSPTVVNCRFENNLVGLGGIWSGCGGGVNNQNNSNPVFIDSTFEGNDGGSFGGGMYNDDSNPTLTNCLFAQNEATEGGGMANFSGAQPTLTNCTFYANEAMYYGGGIYSEENSHIELTNCTFFGNSSQWGSGLTNYDSNPVLTNCILRQTAAIENGGTSAPVVTYSNIQGGYPGIGNIDSDPLFVDPANGDLHLTFTSPSKDTGNSAIVTEPTDFEGDPRIAYGTVDMGADEFYTHLYVTGDKTPGGAIQGKFVGLPGTNPLGLFIGSGVLQSPMPTMWGEYWLQAPFVLIAPLGSIPADGVMVLPTTLPPGMTVPVDIPMQALIGLQPDSLSNLCVLEIR